MCYVISCDFGYNRDHSVAVVAEIKDGSMSVLETIEYPKVDNEVHPEFTNKLVIAEETYQPHKRLNAIAKHRI